MMAAKGYTPDWKSAKLMVREDPYLSVEREKPAGAHIVEAIHRAGASPFWRTPGSSTRRWISTARP